MRRRRTYSLRRRRIRRTNYRRRRTFKRRIVRKAFRTIKRHEVQVLKFRQIVNLAADENGKFRLGINCNGKLWQDTGSFTLNDAFMCYVNSLNNLRVAALKPAVMEQYSKLFASCRMAGFKFQYIPYNPNGFAVWEHFNPVTTDPGPYPLNAGNAPVYFAWDYDGHEQPWSTNEAQHFLDADKLKYFFAQRPYKSRFYRTLKYKPFTRIPSTEATTNPNTNNRNLAGQWHGVKSAMADTDLANGTHFQMYASLSRSSITEHFEDQTIYGKLVFTFYVVCRDKLI